MKLHYKVKSIICVLICFCTSEILVAHSANCSEQDYIALRALYLSTDGDNWTNNTGWFSAAEFEVNPTLPAGTDLGTWNGIMLNDDGCVSILAMSSNNISDTIPSEIGNLEDLTGLSLTSSQLSGGIPAEIGNLSNLTILDLSGNQLSGNIPPAIGNLTELDKLILNHNQLSGSLPEEMSQLTNLTFLVLTANQISGAIPAWIENLFNLEQLRLSSNQFSFNLPGELGNLLNLTLLEVNDNQLFHCYDYRLEELCTQLTHPWFDGNADISDGNNFDATWENFCAYLEGWCIIDDIDNTHQDIFKVYPVPAKDFVVFDVPNITVADEIILYDITGREISRQAFPQNKQLVISDLNNGVYIYRILYDKKMYSGKIVVE